MQAPSTPREACLRHLCSAKTLAKPQRLSANGVELKFGLRYDEDGMMLV
jgi:hypothetical protein